jgi:AhpD family alkylhydroperoxidase
VAFDEAAFEGAAIPLKSKEQTAVAVAPTTQRPYDIEVHATKAREAGATGRELAEVTVVAAALGAGGAMTRETHALESRSSRVGASRWW